MDYFRSKRSNAHQPIEDERPSKRISTPAGQRLSMVLESSHIRSKPTKLEPKSKIEVTTTSTYCNDPTHQHIGPTVHVHEQRKPGFLSVITGGRLGDTPRESLEDHSHNGSNLSVSVWSDPHTPRSEKFTQFKAADNGRRWGWKRLALIGAMVIALIVALAVGLAVGLKKKDSGRCVSVNIWVLEAVKLTFGAVLHLQHRLQAATLSQRAQGQALVPRLTRRPHQLPHSPRPPSHQASLSELTRSSRSSIP